MAYLKNKHLANIKKWKLDLSKLKGGVYYGDIEAPEDIKEFRGFKETFGFEIKEVRRGLHFDECTSLTSVSNLPEWVSGILSFYGCTSLTSILKMPSVVKDNIFKKGCPFFENLTEYQIRKKYGILKE